MNSTNDVALNEQAPLVVHVHDRSAGPLDWEAARPFVEVAEPLRMGQAWMEQPHPGFRPATVWLWKAGDEFLVAAELEDADIFNQAKEFNAPMFRHGDVFEIFVRPAGQDAYFEFHVSPDNQLFQLRLPSAEAREANRGKPLPADWFIEGWKIESRVWMDQEAGRWRVMARLPVARIAERDDAPGDWLFSFSRYDYTRGEEEPVYSSTSPHQKLDYHRQMEWRRVRWTP